ncbi:MAG TPA: SagB/ThcOx family dehydrogenase [Candidatus Aminicenantes bacterium]|nr:SagB/ThcOx family dehydrogenase [Candidatus Aminicenantes bacterium]
MVLLLILGASIHANPDQNTDKPRYKDISEIPISLQRSFLKEYWAAWEKLQTDQRLKKPIPPVQKAYPQDAELVVLVPLEKITLGRMPLIEAMKQRRSRRSFSPDPLSVEELSFLLWSIQGVSRTLERGGKVVYTLRTVPSGGARHPFVTYLVINRVKGIAAGLYRYLPLEHKLLPMKTGKDLSAEAAAACWGSGFVKQAAVVFFWTCVPYRTEWRYGFQSPKIIAQDSGHLCQNLYLAAESIGAGTCAVDGYHQERSDTLLGVDGKDEFTIYTAPVGRISAKEIKNK